MGGMLAMVEQARHATFGAVVNLGSGGDGLPQYLRDPGWATADLAAVRASLADLARVQFGPAPAAGRPAMAFHARDVPAAVREAFARQTTNLIPACALASLLPSGTDPSGGGHRAGLPRLRGARAVPRRGTAPCAATGRPRTSP